MIKLIVMKKKRIECVYAPVSGTYFIAQRYVFNVLERQRELSKSFFFLSLWRAGVRSLLRRRAEMLEADVAGAGRLIGRRGKLCRQIEKL